MKTLKKTLCLVLAVVMAVGVLILPANAAKKDYDAFQDTDEITATYKEAVATLTGMGIINGKDTGFCPKDPVTRGEAMTLIVTALEGANAKYLAAGTTKFADVPVTYFGAPFIAYATAAGIAAGKSETSFEPNLRVTGYELARWLLVASGAMTEFNPAIWQSQTGTAASRNGFLVGLESITNLNAELNREQAAQMIWNAIRYTPDGSSTVFVIYKGETKFTETTDPIEAMAYGNAKYDGEHYYTIQVETSYKNSIAGRYNLKSVTTDTDDFGRSTTKWVNEVSEEVFSVLANNPVAELKGPVYDKDVLDALGKKDATDLTYKAYVDGTPGTDSKTLDKGSKTPIADYGATVEVYTTSTEKEYKIVVINTYVKYLENKDIKNGKITLKPAVANTSAAVTVDANGLVAGDVVSYNLSNKDSSAPKALNVTLLTGVEGTINGKSSDARDPFFRVSGTPKYLSANVIKVNVNSVGTVTVDEDVDFTTDITVSARNTYNFYLDPHGNVLALVAKEAAAVKNTYNYIYVLDYHESLGHDAGAANEWGEDATTEVPARAQIKYVDLSTGTIAIKDLGIVKKDGHYYLAKSNGDASDVDLTTGTGTLNQSRYAAGFYAYTQLLSGDFVINAVSGISDDNGTYSSTLTTTEKNPSIGVDGGTKYANSATKVVLLTAQLNGSGALTSYKVTTYEGYASFKNVTANASATDEHNNKLGVGAYVFTDEDNANVVTNVYVFGKASGKVSVPKNDWFVFIGVGEVGLDDDGNEITTYNFLYNGEEVSFTGRNSGDTKFDLGSVDPYDVVTVALYDNGTLKTVTTSTAGVRLNVAVVTDEFIASTSAVKTLASDCVVLDFCDDDSCEGKEAVQVGDSVTYYTVGGSDSDAEYVSLIIINHHSEG